MKHYSYILLLPSIVFLFFRCASPPQASYNDGINITPLPLECVVGEGEFRLSANTSFVSSDTASGKIAAFFAAKLRQATGFAFPIKNDAEKDIIRLSIVSDIPVNDEGYLLEVADGVAAVRAKTPQGLFYGMQTLLQLLPAEIESRTIVKNGDWTIPSVKIKDEPRFAYRGWHLDVCRHFFDVEFIKKQLDVLSMFKINTLHWHLTEDQGWRIEIKKYPELTKTGATRIEGDGETYGPYFYTQEEVKEVVAYAKERFITVIPEIELPGHAVAAIAAYPELSCTGDKIAVRNHWGVARDVFCAGNDDVFRFLEDVIAEVAPLFESEYIHIGGDECPKYRWEHCPKCQARIRQEHLAADERHSKEERLQSYFVQRMEKVLLKHGKKMIGWDEILEGGLAPSATVMSWRGEEGGIAAANMGHDVIMTPAAWAYADRYQGDSKILPVTIGGYMPLEMVYGYNPMPAAIADDKKHHVLGPQMNTWTEYKYKAEDVEHDIYPRIIAMLEVGWSAMANKDYSDFLRRLDNQRVRLDMHDVAYYIPLPQQKGSPSCDFVAFTESAVLEFETTEPVKMVYTTNGKEPDLQSTTYDNAPLTFSESATLKIRSLLPSGKMSKVRSIRLEKQTYAAATELSDSPQGLNATYYKGETLFFKDLENKKSDGTEWMPTPQASKYDINSDYELYDYDFYSTVLTGFINIPEDAVYYFSTDCEFWLDGQRLISNEADNQGSARRFSRSDKSIALAKGYHPVTIVRLGAVFGGFPSQWSAMTLSIRKEGEPQFTVMDESYFR